jgi:hypothetical protein
MFEREWESKKDMYPLKGRIKSEFVVEGREINHACGWQDLNKYISRRRFDEN